MKGIRRRSFVGALLAGASVLSRSRAAWAAPPVELEAQLLPDELRVGESALLEVVVTTRDGASAGPPRPPRLPGLVVESIGGLQVSSSFAFGGGQQNSERHQTYRYRVTPMRAGEYLLDFAVPGPTGNLRLDPIPTLRAHGEDLDAAGDEEAAASSAADFSAGTAAGDVFLRELSSAARVYVGQQIVYDLEVWDASGRKNISISQRPSFKDFFAHDLEVAKERREVLDGRAYRVYPSLRRVLFPQRAGTLKIGAAQIDVTELAGIFFSAGASERITGEGVEIEVLALPVAGQPPNFSGHQVGRFEIATQIDRDRVQVGDALTLTVTISGEGNLSLAEPDAWPEVEGFSAYEAHPEDATQRFAAGRLRGERRFTVLFVAKRPGTHTIPAYAISYFDPERGTYATSRSKPLSVLVEGDAPSEDRAGAGLTSGATTTPEGGAQPLAFAPVRGGSLLADRRAPTSAAARQDAHRHARWLAAGVPLLLAAHTLVAVVRPRLAPSAAARARAQRERERQALLARARAGVDSGSGFWTAVGELARRMAIERAGERGHGLTREALVRLLAGEGIDATALADWVKLCEACDAARFGAAPDELARRRAALAGLEALLGSPRWQPVDGGGSPHGA